MSRVSIATLLHVSLITTMGNACAYLVQLLLARLLAPADFGAVNAVFAVSMIVSAPLAVAPMVMSRMMLEAGQDPPAQAGLVKRFHVVGLAIAAAIWAMHLPIAPLVAHNLEVSATVAAVMLPLLVVSTLLLQVPVGIWQGRGDYSMMAVGGAAAPIFRFAAACILVALAGGTLLAALWSFVLGGLLVFLWGAWSFRGELGAPSVRPAANATRAGLKFALPAVFGMLGLLGLTYIDVPIVRAVAGAEASGPYAAASTLAKISLLLPAALAGVVFPEAAKLNQRAQSSSDSASLRLILLTLGFTVALSGGASLVMMVVPKLVLEMLTGNAYAGAAPYLQLLAPAMTCLAVANVLVTYALARSSYVILVPTLAALAITVIAPVLLQLNSYQTAITMLGVLATLCAACLVWLFVTHRAPGAGTGRSEPPGR